MLENSRRGILKEVQTALISVNPAIFWKQNAHPTSSSYLVMGLLKLDKELF
jgi:hypothetical protein